jgi:hypothetical protein
VATAFFELLDLKLIVADHENEKFTIFIHHIQQKTLGAKPNLTYRLNLTVFSLASVTKFIIILLLCWWNS